jgi:hypothetical protein
MEDRDLAARLVRDPAIAGRRIRAADEHRRSRLSTAKERDRVPTSAGHVGRDPVSPITVALVCAIITEVAGAHCTQYSTARPGADQALALVFA